MDSEARNERSSGNGLGGYRGRFSVLADGSADGGWETRSNDNKRRKRSSGGTYETFEHDSQDIIRENVLSNTQFRELSTDDKLVTLFELMSSVSTVSTRLHKTENNVASLQCTVKNDQSRIRVLEYKSIDLEARNRRHNLIFRGIKENPLIDEDCTLVIQKFIKDHLKLDLNPYIQRAHRLGNPQRGRRNRAPLRPGQQQSPRPIIACFRDFKDVEAILANAYKLANTPLGINRDYPKEILDARAEIWPLYKAERQKYPKGSLYVGFPAKLIVNRRVVVDKFPDWHEVLRKSRVECRKTVSSGSANAIPPRSLVQGFPVSAASGSQLKDQSMVGPITAQSEQVPSSSSSSHSEHNEGIDVNENVMDIESVHSDVGQAGSQTSAKYTEGESASGVEKSAYDLAMGILNEHLLSQSLLKNATGNIRKQRSNSVPPNSREAVPIATVLGKD